MHDRHLGIDVGPGQSQAMAFHWSRGAALLNDRLTQGVVGRHEKDALWASAVLLATLAFASIEVDSTPERAWPLDPAANLDWLKLIDGKKEIWKIADPRRADSIFHPRIPRFVSSADKSVDPSSLPPKLVQICLADTSSTAYLGPLSSLARLTNIPCTPETFGLYFAFFGAMTPEFKHLLTQKDPAALVVLASWYARVGHLRQWWWLWRRASLEGRAICRHLRQFNADSLDIIGLVSDLEALLDRQAASPP